MRRFVVPVLALLTALAGAATLAAQPAPAPTPQPRGGAKPAPGAPLPRGEQPETPRPGDRTFTFQLVLLAAETSGAPRFENVPANAQKALEDVKGFLPYTSYKLLDLAWLRSSRSAEAQISGPDGRSLSASIRFYSDAADPERIEIQRLVIVDPDRMPLLLEAPRKDGAPTAIAPIAPQPIRPLLETSFGMRAGETVVVGTARLDGPSKALVVILSAIP